MKKFIILITVVLVFIGFVSARQIFRMPALARMNIAIVGGEVPAPGGASPPTMGNDAEAQSTNSSAVCTTGSIAGVSAGDLLIGVGTGTEETMTITSSPAESWTEVTEITTSGRQIVVAWAEAGSTSAYTVTSTAAANDYQGCWGGSVSGAWDATPVGDDENATATGTAVDTADLDPTNPAILILALTEAYTGSNETITPNGDWTEVADLDNDITSQPVRVHYRIVNSGGTYPIDNSGNPVYSASETWQAISVAFQVQ